MNEYKVKWSPSAKKDLIKIVMYIKYEKQNEIAAKNFEKKVYSAIVILKNMPNAFQRVEINNKEYRKLVIQNYIVFYSVNIYNVNIHRILHSRQSWSQLL
jgi:plasmid stabilization system protein ParE